MKKKCAACGHAYEYHASDVSFPDVERCFYGAHDGTGCREVYADRCKDYVNPEEKK